MLELRTTHQDSNPIITVDSVNLDTGKLHVVRDDLLAGGTKQRAAIPYLRDLVEEGFDEFIYASPFSGFAQVALAYAAETVGVDCTLFCEPDPKTMNRHTFTQLAASMGARIGLAPKLTDCEREAEKYVATRPTGFKIPLGFDDQRYRDYLAESLDIQWQNLRRNLGRNPESLWISLGSGTLTRVLNDVLPSYVDINCVDVHVLKNDDARIKSACAPARVHYHSAPETFQEIAKAPPPLPSNAYYDAKVWQFVSENSQDGDVWWNVAR